LPFFLFSFFFFLFFFFVSNKKVLSYSQCFVNGTLVGDMHTWDDATKGPFLVRGRTGVVEFDPNAGVVANNEVFFRPGGGAWQRYSLYQSGSYFLNFSVPSSVVCESWWTNTMYRYLIDGTNHYCNDLTSVYDPGPSTGWINTGCIISGCRYPAAGNTTARWISVNNPLGLYLELVKGSESELCSSYSLCINNGANNTCRGLQDLSDTGMCFIQYNSYSYWSVLNSITARLTYPVGYNPRIGEAAGEASPYFPLSGGYCGGQIIPTNTPVPTVAPTSTPVPTSTPGGPTSTPVPTGTPVPLPTCYYWQVEANNGSRRRLSPVWHFCLNSVVGRWFQTRDGDILARGDITSIIPSGAASRFLSINGSGGYPGVVSYGSNIDLGTDGSISSTSWQTRKDYLGPTIGFDYLRNRLGVETENDTFVGTMPTEDGVYYSSTNRNLSGNFPSGRKIIIFVNGDVMVENNLLVPAGSFFALIARGNITFSAVTPVIRAQGFFLADGMINTGAASEQLIGQGSFVGWGGFNFQRDLADNTTPGELFINRPDYYVNAPSEFLFTPSFFQEVEP